MTGSARHRPIFADLRGRRAKAANFTFIVATVSFLITVTIISFGILTGPRLSLPGPPAPAGNLTSRAAGLLVTPPTERPLQIAAGRQIPDKASHVLRMAFLPTEEQPGGMLSLKKHARELDAVIPAWLTLIADQITDQTSIHLRQSEKQNVVIEWIRNNTVDTIILPQITNELARDKLFTFFSNPVTRLRIVTETLDYLEKNNFPGLVIDTRSFSDLGFRRMSFFLDEISQKLKGEGRKLYLRVAPDMEILQLRELSGIADYVIAATEDENQVRSFTEQGAAGAQAWFEERLAAIAASVPPAKLIFTIGAYGFDIDSMGMSNIISVQRAWDLMARAKSEPKFDGRSLNPTFTYDDDQGHRHRVWLLDGTTAFNHAKAALSLKPAGIAVWRLGLEDPSIWASIGRARIPDNSALEQIKTPAPGYGSHSGLEGALLSGKPGSSGERSFRYDPGLGLITDARLKRIPRVVEPIIWRGHNPKAIALTFDDGPDPEYTEKILDILAEKEVKATFYVTGRYAAGLPHLIKRIYAEGHDIGNHTFSHVNLIGISSVRLTTELNMTARIVESITGARIRLFRPPYAGLAFNYLDADPNLVLGASALGYMFGGLDVQSCDWCSMNADWIVRNVMDGVLNQHGRIVLMHDGGGDREPTIKALPEVIDRLRNEGFHFVTTHELVNLPRDALMPRMPQDNLLANAEGSVWRATAILVVGLGKLIEPMAIITALLGIFRLTLVMGAAVKQSRHLSRAPPRDPFNGTFSVLVPAYNERTVICKTVSSVLSSTIAHRIKVAVIDDGSLDGTFEIVREQFADDPRVVVFRKENGGKSAALNYGIDHTDSDIIVAIDGDTILLPDAIEKLTAHFNDPNVGAAAGNVVVGNRNNLLTRFQALEYVTSQNLDRRAFELFRAVGVVPGAIGAWRREALIQAGGYSNDTLAEDADLTLAIQRRGWKVVSEPNAFALTEAPETLRAFMKQRFRWMFGNLQAAYKHLGALLQAPNGISLVALPNTFLFQFGFSLFAPIMDAILFLTLFLAASAALFQTSGPDSMLVILAAYWLVFQAVDISAALLGIKLDPRGGYLPLVPLIIVQRFTYRQLLYVTAIRALLAALKGTIVGWGKLVRTGSVAIAPARAQ